jgi:hypothetical protein
MQARRVEGSAEQPTPPVYSKPDVPTPQEHGWNFIHRNQHDRNEDGTVGWNQREWEEDKERLKEIQKRAEDAMLDMSESTLESIVSTVEALKTVRPPIHSLDPASQNQPPETRPTQDSTRARTKKLRRRTREAKETTFSICLNQSTVHYICKSSPLPRYPFNWILGL